MTAPIRIVLVDDEPLILAGLRAILGHEADMEVVGEAANGIDGLTGVAATDPDVPSHAEPGMTPVFTVE